MTSSSSEDCSGERDRDVRPVDVWPSSWDECDCWKVDHDTREVDGTGSVSAIVIDESENIELNDTRL